MAAKLYAAMVCDLSMQPAMQDYADIMHERRSRLPVGRINATRLSPAICNTCPPDLFRGELEETAGILTLE